MGMKNDAVSFYEQVRRSLEAIDDPGKLKDLSAIEVDLIKDRLRDLYDRLSAATFADGGAVREEREERGPVEVEFELPAASLSPTVVDEEIHQSETETMEIGSEEILSAKSATTEPRKPPAAKGPQPDLFSPGDGPSPEPAKRSVAEAIQGEEKKESVAEKLQKQARVNSLKNSIGINEKFFFINELFEGNLSEYNAAIESLDGMASSGAADGLLQELAVRYRWEDHEEAAGQLKEFVERRFS